MVFGAAGFVATIPMLRRLRRLTGSWRAPALALAAFAAIFTFSTLLIGPAVSGSDTPSDTATPTEDVDHHGHDDSADARS